MTIQELSDEMRKERARCSTYCGTWNSEHKDCEIYGEHHCPPSKCRYFLATELARRNKELYQMTEEEYFRKHYPDSCRGDKPLSPYWDFFQDGVEFGERQSEEKITDLEETINKLREQFALRYDLEDKLKKENAELNNFIIQSKKDGISPINALIIKNLGNQLIKAKEIIREIMKYEIPTLDYVKAEQFLKEIEK